MKEERNDYNEDENIVELVDDEGNTFRFEHLMTFVYAHKQAGILTYWHRYTDIQAKRLEGIANLLLETYPSLSEVVGHSHITARKQDPGPALGCWATRGREFHLELPEHQNNRIIYDLQNI